MAKTAILIDGGFYRKKVNEMHGFKSAKDTAKDLIEYCYKHIQDDDDLYRIFYYDCPPISKKMQHPLTKAEIDFSKTDLYKWFNKFIEEMVTKRKVALRLGRLSEENASYILAPSALKKLCDAEIGFSDLKEEDFILDVRQKGVDMKIGVDIASLAYKKQVDRIVLIAGDSDFVPASKLARREGIDFILDPLWNHINPDLREHIDGLFTHMDNPHAKKKKPHKAPKAAKVKAK